MSQNTGDQAFKSLRPRHFGQQLVAQIEASVQPAQWLQMIFAPASIIVASLETGMIA